VLREGTILFDGTTLDLLDAARGKVWTLSLPPGARPSGDLIVVSTLHLGTSVQYRVVGFPSDTAQAVAAAPSLEDGYVWLMRERRASSATRR
jgi:ABC-2 type transport system ATP-binding protein